MLDLPLRSEVLHGAGNILNRYRWIDAVLIEEFNGINPQRLLGYRRMRSAPAISLDGSLAVYYIWNRGAREFDLYSISTAGGQPRLVCRVCGRR